MILEPGRRNARKYLEDLAASGHYNFTLREAQSWLGASVDASRLALFRLTKKHLVASPARGFFVIVPPEYRSLGCLPAEQFIPALMKHLCIPYYAGLLTAAQYHGAAHQRPQEFQVFVDKPRRPIECGKVRVSLMVRKRIRKVPVQSFNTPRGTVLVSTPEATALDLVGYKRRAGGLNSVATVLAELAEQINPEKLPMAAAAAPVAWAQRLGYLLDRVGAGEKASALRVYVRKHARDSTSLLPNEPYGDFPRDEGWKLYINADVQAEI